MNALPYQINFVIEPGIYATGKQKTFILYVRTFCTLWNKTLHKMHTKLQHNKKLSNVQYQRFHSPYFHCIGC